MTADRLLERADRLRSGRTPFVLATVVRAQRPTSAKAGDRALILPDGTMEGFVGGTCAESTVRTTGLRLLATGESTLLRITPEEQPDAPAGPVEEGMLTVANPCLSGGTLEIFLEPRIPPLLVHVFGDAPVARALATVGAPLGYDVRATADPEAPLAPDTAAVVVASHGRDEEPVLHAALRAGVPYVGLVASRRRGAAVLAGLAELGVGDDERARVHTPAGLDIGARTPPEIALSIYAELLAARPAHPAGVGPAGVGPVAATLAGGGLAGSGPAGVAEATDPVCGMTVAVTPAAPRTEYDGTAWYFCGTGCLRAFGDAPTRYLA